MKIFGVKAKVHLKFNGEIVDITNIISKRMSIPKFSLESREESPHEIYAFSESTGFEIWLEKSDTLEKYPFSLKFETSLSTKESYENQMHDISPWLARFVSKICEIDSCIYDLETKSYVSFKNGETIL